MSATAFARGKLLLFGEHAAVYGYPAVGTSLPRGLTVSYTAGTGREWSLILNDETAETTFDPAPFLDHLETTLARYLDNPGELPPGILTVHPDLPLSSGFGSSAALCTALVTLLARNPVSGDPAAVWAVAHELERFFHGTPSGIDTGLSALGGIRAFHFEKEGVLPRAVPCALPPMKLVVGSVPRETDTRTLVAGVRERLESNRKETGAHLQALGEISRGVISRASSGGIDQFARAMDEAQEHLRSLGLSTDLLETIMTRGKDAGAMGAKLSGAGGGGAFYLACPDDDTVCSVISALRGVLPRGSTLFPMELP